MFEDSTFESGGRIKSKSGRWALVTGSINASVLILLILIPLIYPEALPKAAMQMALVAPPPPPPEAVHVIRVQSEMMNNQLTAPTRIPHDILIAREKEAPVASFGVAGSDFGGSASGVMGSIFGDAKMQVKAAPPKKVSISGGVMAGNLILKVTPNYPPIAKAARVQGTVVLQATISKTGSIENLRVITGPQMLQQAALDAVKAWRYRPYLLSGEPVEVDTTINVVFTLGG
jgi:protein TonB